MKRYAIAMIMLCCWLPSLVANDGVYFMRGNQLIPITDADISVKKEVLNIRCTGGGDRYKGTAYIDVQYEFFNSGKEKKVLVGFEAMPPYGAWFQDSLARVKYPEHPHIEYFNVEVNGVQNSFNVAHVDRVDSIYYNKGKFLNVDAEMILKNEENEDMMSIPFYYVYYFYVDFKPGLNKIHHTYAYEMSLNIDDGLHFAYVLSAATRWAGGAIGDFTLNIEMQPMTTIYLAKTFFKDASEWQIDGYCLTNDYPRSMKYNFDEENGGFVPVPSVQFHIQDARLCYHKKNFRPRIGDEIYLSCGMAYSRGYNVVEDIHDNYGYIHYDDFDLAHMSNEDKRILRNLPFAFRGYIFRDKDLQKVYESTAWYLPNPEYKANMSDLSESEQRWVNRFK